MPKHLKTGSGTKFKYDGRSRPTDDHYRNRWNEIFESRKKWSTEKNLDISFVEELYKLIHIASIKSQTEILNKK